MPLLPSTYNSNFLLRNGHISTVFCGVFRTVNDLLQKRERITTPDDDFIDLDWSYTKHQTKKVVIVIHGLEGNAQRAYIKGSVKQFIQAGYDACAVNLRGCSGETNKKFISYHSGVTEDLEIIINHILNTKKYTEIYLNGFSLGGNIVLKYLGERNDVPKAIKGAATISVPVDLHSSLKQLLSPENFLYADRFKKYLVEKLRVKQKIFPEKLSDADIESIKTLKDFDDVYTSKAHGFKNALDYYAQCSSLQFLENIKVPTLLINALNDSFLGSECYPFKEAKNNPSLFLETPKYGGHVGFYGFQNITYTEKKVVNFINELL